MKKIVALLFSTLLLVTLSQAVTLTIIQPEGTVTMTRPAGSRIKLKSTGEGIKWWKVREGNVEVEDGGFVMPNENVSVEAMYTGNLITVTQAEGGKIKPGTVGVEEGGSKTFTITPDIGYSIGDVLVDGVSVGARTSYEFTNVTAPHTITAVFNTLAGNIVSIKNNSTIIQTIKKQLETINIATTNEEFGGWTSKGITLENPKEASQTMQMPGNPIEIVEEDKANLKLSIDGTIIELEKQVGETIELNATINANEEFGGWLAKGITLSNPMNLEISFTMPDNNVEIIASKHKTGQGATIQIESENETIELEKQVGETVTLTTEIQSNIISWDVYGVEIDNPVDSTITFIMPSNDVYIKINK